MAAPKTTAQFATVLYRQFLQAKEQLRDDRGRDVDNDDVLEALLETWRQARQEAGRP